MGRYFILCLSLFTVIYCGDSVTEIFKLLFLQILQKYIGILLDFDSGLIRGMKGLELSTEQRKVLRDYGC